MLEDMNMKKYTCAAIGALLALTITATAAFTPPTQAQIDSAAQNPSELAALLADATDAQAVSVISAVVTAVDALNLTQIQKKRRCGEVFTAVANTLGTPRAQLVLPQVVATMPPGIVPTTGTGAPFNIPRRPQQLPKYTRQ